MLKKIKKFLNHFGPGIITGSSDDDPSGIATYSQTGAIYGYHQLWTALFSLPFMIVIQEMCGRIGMITGRGLSGVIRKHYSKKILYSAVLILFIANTITIGANLGAMASAAQLILNLPFFFYLFVIVFITLILEVFVSYRTYSKVLIVLTFSLFAYIITAFIVRQDWATIINSTFFPSIAFSQAYLLNVVAILGTTISPYLFFWQAGEEVEEEVARHKLHMMGAGVPRVTRRDIREMRIDTMTGMFFSNIVMFFIIITSASTLYTAGITNIETADQAALALRPIAGDWAFLLFAVGIIGTGLLAVPILAGSASYAISEAFGWKEGLYRKFKQAHGFYAVIIISTLLGLLINIGPIPPFKMLYYAAILNGILAPPLMILILLIANNKTIMNHHVNSPISNIFGWGIASIMSLLSFVLLLSFIF